MEGEKRARLRLIHSFGAQPATAAAAGLAEQLFLQHAGGNPRGAAVIGDLRVVFYELGYWLGAEFDFARASLDGTGAGEFTFRDLVAWWTQSQRAFLMLFDDAAFRLRSECVLFPLLTGLPSLYFVRVF